MTSRAGSLAVVTALVAMLVGGCDLARVDQGEPDWLPQGDNPSAANPRHAPGVSEWQGRTGVAFTMDLPSDWHDMTAAYKSETPDTVLTTFVTTGDSLYSSEAFATLSTHRVTEDRYPRGAVSEDLDDWASRMTDPVYGASGGIATDAGGAGWWGSVTGIEDGELTTIHSVHLFHGPYELMVLIESYQGDDDLAASFLESLSTVEFTGPAPVEGRHGAPAEADGRWEGYCGVVSVEAQAWDYDFTPTYDSTTWRCPEAVDYLGAWVVDVAGRDYDVVAVLEAGLDASEARSKRFIPATVGSPEVSPHGFTFTVQDEAVVALNPQATVTRLTQVVATPDGVPSSQVVYLVDLGEVGTVMVLVSPGDGEPAGDTTWVEPFVSSLRAEQ